ncbi:MAG: BON domain-containing protein [Burkholderiales bacterium]
MKSAFIRMSLIVAALAAGLAGCAGAGQKTGTAVDDSAITTKVKTAMVRDSEVVASNISVETNQGTVRLSGTASSAREADKAEQIARNTPGVKSVKNDIRVQ